MAGVLPYRRRFMGAATGNQRYLTDTHGHSYHGSLLGRGRPIPRALQDTRRVERAVSLVAWRVSYRNLRSTRAPHLPAICTPETSTYRVVVARFVCQSFPAALERRHLVHVASFSGAPMMPSKPLTVEKLSDNFGDYKISLNCTSCRHVRVTMPHPLAAWCGWNALLVDVVKRMRCTQCGQRACVFSVFPATKRDYR